jgi:hypothetical protein
LDGLSLLRVAAVSQWWRDVCDDEHVWRALCVRLNIDTSRQIGWMRLTFAGVFSSVDSSSSSDVRYAHVHAACPSKVVYMRHQRTGKNWRSQQVVVRTHKLGE